MPEGKYFEEPRHCAYKGCDVQIGMVCPAKPPALPDAISFVPNGNYSGYATPRGYWCKEHTGIWHTDLSAGC